MRPSRDAVHVATAIRRRTEAGRADIVGAYDHPVLSSDSGQFPRRSKDRTGSGLEVPEGSVVPNPFLVRYDAVGLEELVLVPLTEVPVEAERGDRQVGPAITHREIAEVDMSRPCPILGDEGVGRAGVAMNEHEFLQRGARPERRRSAIDPSLRGPLGREVVDVEGVDRTQPGGDGPNRFGATNTPRIADGWLTWHGGGDEPLGVDITAGGEDLRGWVSGRDPLETDAFPLEVDAGATRVPLDEPIVDLERQPAQIVAPDEVGRSAVGELEHDGRNGIVAERVQRGERGEVWFDHGESHGR